MELSERIDPDDLISLILESSRVDSQFLRDPHRVLDATCNLLVARWSDLPQEARIMFIGLAGAYVRQIAKTENWASDKIDALMDDVKQHLH